MDESITVSYPKDNSMLKKAFTTITADDARKKSVETAVRMLKNEPQVAKEKEFKKNTQ